jgi:RNA polymerase sigma factor (TIGR02999 family)
MTSPTLTRPRPHRVRGQTASSTLHPTPGAPTNDLTRLLNQAEGRADAWRAVFELVYDELRALAAAQMGRERAGHTLQSTALVNEAWLRLAGDAAPKFETRRHFFGAAARAMQRVLTDHARKVLAGKRGAGCERMTLTGLDLAASEDPERSIEVSDAIEALEREDERAAEVVRLRLFAGLEVAQAADALGVSERTAAREWAYGRARLVQLLGE